jgi:hypothetical protein
MRAFLTFVICAAGAIGAAGSAAAAAGETLGCHLQSSADRAALLELYTSEGCSSCPPADRWLSELASGSSRLPVVPLAFHVDYWNGLGWADRFAQPSFSERQRRAAVRSRSSMVYTPQFVLDGRDWRQWRDSRDRAERLRQVGHTPAGATIDLRAGLKGTAIEVHGSVQLLVPNPAEGTGVYVAVFENGLSTPVRRGENAGKTLHHDYVVRAVTGPLLPKPNGALTLSLVIPAELAWDRQHLGIAAFAQDLASGATLQAASVAGCL